MKNPRGLLIDMEGFIQSKTDDAFIKKLSSELNSKFKLFIFTDIPKEKQTEINYIQRESKKMFNRANLMLTAYSREIKRTEILEGLFLGHNIITFNYCFEKIINALNEDLDINFAKRLFKGMIRPDVVIFHNCEKNLEDIFHECKMINNYKNDRENIIEKYENEIIELYKSTLDYYGSWCDDHRKNYFPKSIGEDLFIDY